MRRIPVGIMLMVWLLVAGWCFAEKPFSEVVGAGTVGDVAKTAAWQVPFITWGGDVATFYANGGLTTKPDSIFAKQGLNVKLTPGDDFAQQVRDYQSGKSPFLRGTFHMIGLASEVIGADPRTKGVVILQMTWSAGDHFVVRGDKVKKVADLKGKKIVLQAYGPHVGMLDDILKTAQLSWDDISVVWAKDLTGSPQSPAEIFRSDPSIDGCFVISPDMLGLCGDLRSTGSGAEGTIKGAKVLVSTAELSRSIADVYVCRKDFYDANREQITKFVAGYLKASEEVQGMKKQYETSGSPQYLKMLQMAQDIYGKKVLPTLETDAHGLMCDCTLVGYAGNVAFFTEKGNLNGFESFQTAALNLATSRGYAKVKAGLIPSGLDYASPAFAGYLKNIKVERQDRFKAEAVATEIESLQSGQLDDRTLYAFSINFKSNQNEFSAVQYGAEFQRVVELSGKYGNAVLAIRGHADPTKILLELVKAGTAKNILQRSGTQGNYQYFFNGKPLDLASTPAILKLIEEGNFDGVPSANPRETMQAALNLSRSRAEAVRDSIIKYASDKGLVIDKSQIQPLGVGAREPLVAKPSNMPEAEKNMRVEFRLIRVDAETVNKNDFNF